MQGKGPVSQTAGHAPRILVIGYGNPGRLDDGLGPAVASAMEEFNLPGVSVDSNYQLTVEDAASAAGTRGRTRST